MISHCKLLVLFLACQFGVKYEMQAQEYLFIDFPSHLDAEFENLIRDNSIGKWIPEVEIESIKYACNHTFKPNYFLYEFLVDQGKGDCEDNFEVVYFSFYWYEYPPYPVVLIVYKHLNKEIYKKVSMSMDKTDNVPLGSIKGCSYFDVFLEELNVEYKLNSDYEPGRDLNFYGFGVHFENQKIEKVKIFHDFRYLNKLTNASNRIW